MQELAKTSSGETVCFTCNTCEMEKCYTRELIHNWENLGQQAERIPVSMEAKRNEMYEMLRKGLSLITKAGCKKEKE